MHVIFMHVANTSLQPICAYIPHKRRHFCTDFTCASACVACHLRINTIATPYLHHSCLDFGLTLLCAHICPLWKVELRLVMFYTHTCKTDAQRSLHGLHACRHVSGLARARWRGAHSDARWTPRWGHCRMSWMTEPLTLTGGRCDIILRLMQACFGKCWDTVGYTGKGGGGGAKCRTVR